MHKNIYFPISKGRVNPSRSRGNPAASETNSQSSYMQKQKEPVNFLFSNEDYADDDSDDET